MTMMYCLTCDSIVYEMVEGNLCKGCGDEVALNGVVAIAEKRGADAAIAKIREWVMAQKIRCIESREALGDLENLESWLKWRGSEHTVDALLEYLEEIEL